MEVDVGMDNESDPELHASSSSSSELNATPAVMPSMAMPTAPAQVKIFF